MPRDRSQERSDIMPTVEEFSRVVAYFLSAANKSRATLG